jgi:hypothetical protein
MRKTRDLAWTILYHRGEYRAKRIRKTRDLALTIIYHRGECRAERKGKTRDLAWTPYIKVGNAEQRE